MSVSSSKMELWGKINPFSVAIILIIAPFYSLCLEHNITLPLKNVVAHDEINATNVNATLAAGQLQANNPASHSTMNLTVGKPPLPTPEPKLKPVSASPSSSIHHPSRNDSVHATGRENVPLKVDHTPKPGVRQMMEGGGTLHDLDAQHKALEKGAVEANNLTAGLTDLPKMSLEPHKNISPRKGAPVEMLTDKLPVVMSSTTTTTTTSTTTTTTTTTRRPTKRKMKPQFTMIKGDKFSKESESFIESPTTGKDYVLPLVLIIFAVPGFVFLVKFLYKRGTEFTERQQYHRMYLIDGDSRTHFLEKWGRVMKSVFWADNLQTVNLTKFGDVSLNPRMNYHSF